MGARQLCVIFNLDYSILFKIFTCLYVMASNAWISCLSDSDDGLPSCSLYLHSQKKVQDSDSDGYKPLMKRLAKTDPIDLVSSGSSNEKELSACEKRKDLIVNERKPPSKRKKAQKKDSQDKENEKVEVFKPEDLYGKLYCTISHSVLELFASSTIMSSIKDNLPVACDFIHETEPVITWHLNLPTSECKNNKELFCSNQKLFVVKAEQLVNLASGKKLNSSGFALSEWLLSNSDSSTHLVCFALKKFKQMLKRNKNRQLKKAVLGDNAKKPPKKNNEQIEIAIEDIPEIFVDIQFSYGVDIIVIENESDFTLLLAQISKAMAETPLKRSQRKDVQFVHGNAVKIDATTGAGAGKAWKLMLEQLFSVSSDISSAIAVQYPSMKCLIEAYERTTSSDAALLLSNIVVRRGVGTLQQSRRIGPELSKRIHKLFSTDDKDEVI